MTDVWEERPATVLAAGKFVGDGKRLDPNVPSTREFVFLVPRHQFQLLRLRAQLFAIPSSLQLSRRAPPEYTSFAGDRELYGYWEVVDHSWLHDLIYGRERWVVMRYELVTRENTRASLTSDVLFVRARFPHATWRRGKPSESLLHRLFDEQDFTDSSVPFSAAEMPLESVAEPTAVDPASCRAG
jgi:hypothetical protein